MLKHEVTLIIHFDDEPTPRQLAAITAAVSQQGGRVAGGGGELAVTQCLPELEAAGVDRSTRDALVAAGITDRLELERLLLLGPPPVVKRREPRPESHWPESVAPPMYRHLVDRLGLTDERLLPHRLRLAVSIYTALLEAGIVSEELLGLDVIGLRDRFGDEYHSLGAGWARQIHQAMAELGARDPSVVVPDVAPGRTVADLGLQASDLSRLERHDGTGGVRVTGDTLLSKLTSDLLEQLPTPVNGSIAWPIRNALSTLGLVATKQGVRDVVVMRRERVTARSVETVAGVV